MPSSSLYIFSVISDPAVIKANNLTENIDCYTKQDCYTGLSGGNNVLFLYILQQKHWTTNKKLFYSLLNFILEYFKDLFIQLQRGRNKISSGQLAAKCETEVYCSATRGRPCLTWFKSQRRNPHICPTSSTLFFGGGGLSFPTSVISAPHTVYNFTYNHTSMFIPPKRQRGALNVSHGGRWAMCYLRWDVCEYVLVCLCQILQQGTSTFSTYETTTSYRCHMLHEGLHCQSDPVYLCSTLCSL